GAGRCDRVGDGVEDGYAKVGRAALARADSAHEPGPKSVHLLRVERAFAARDALDDDLRGGVEKDAHLTPTRVSWTIFCAASHALTPGSMPFLCRISRPSSMRVPLRRTTRGSFIFRLSRAVTMPLATSSPRVMPPKTLIRTPFTFGFIRITASA